MQETVDYYVNHFGLDIEHRAADRVSLKGTGRQARQVTFFAGERARLRGLAFDTHPSSDLAAIAGRLRSGDVRVDGLSERALSVKDPDGTTITLTRGDGENVDEANRPSHRPIFLSHVVINSPQSDRLVRFYVETLGFRISDKYERGLLTFLRADQPQHHCIGISPAAYSGLNHFAMDCGTIDGVMVGIGRMKRAGIEPLWGPGRHGPGGNIFCYFEDPNGFVAEFTCDVLSIPGDDQWIAKEWPRTPEVANTWGTGGPSPRAVKLMSDNPPQLDDAHEAL